MAHRQDADCTVLLDSSDFFDPPAWVPGRYLQFADFSSADEEAALWPVSLPAEAQEDASVHVPQNAERPDTNRWLLPLTKRRLIAMTSCVATVLAVLGFVTYAL